MESRGQRQNVLLIWSFVGDCPFCGELHHRGVCLPEVATLLAEANQRIRELEMERGSMVDYEGRIEIQDVEPGVSGDVFVLLDSDEDYETLDGRFARAYQVPDKETGVPPFCFGTLPGRYRIRIERI